MNGIKEVFCHHGWIRFLPACLIQSDWMTLFKGRTDRLPNMMSILVKVAAVLKECDAISKNVVLTQRSCPIPTNGCFAKIVGWALMGTEKNGWRNCLRRDKRRKVLDRKSSHREHGHKLYLEFPVHFDCLSSLCNATHRHPILFDRALFGI